MVSDRTLLSLEGTVPESARDQIKRQIEDPTELFVGPYEKNGDHEADIHALAWAAGYTINEEGFAIDAEE